MREERSRSSSVDRRFRVNITSQKASLLDRAIIGALLLLGSLLLGIQIAKAAPESEIVPPVSEVSQLR